MDKHQPKAPNTQAAPLNDVPTALGSIGDQLGRLTKVLASSNELQQLQEQRSGRIQLDYYRELNEALLKFADELKHAAPRSTEALTKAQELASSERIQQRDVQGMSRSSIVSVWDEWSIRAGALTATVSGTLKALEHYASEATQTRITKLLQEIQDPLATRHAVQLLQSEFDSLRGIVKVLLEQVSNFPGWCSTLTNDIQNNASDARAKIGAAEDDEESTEDKAPSLRDLFSPPKPKKFDVPTYKNNPQLTLLLAELSHRIPSPISKTSGEQDGLSSDRFRSDLLALADQKVLSWARTQQMYMRLGRVVEHTHASLLCAVVAADAVHLAALLDRDPMRPGNIYDRALQETQRSVPGAKLDNTAFKEFDSSSTRSFLAKFQPYRTGAASGTKAGDSEATEPSDHKSERHLEIFAKLERLLERLSEKTPSISSEQIEQEIKELRELKKELAKGEEKRSGARLARDKKLGTYAFEAQQGQLGALTFNRVPTDNVSYDSVVGKSWRTVEEKLEPLIRHGDLGYLYNFGSMRGRQNNNMLIIGPYGCGKNMFLRALMADPRTIGVKVTLDRLASVWHAQSERNTRKVFELAHEKRVQLDKPAVIGWDEFDSLYGTGRSGGVSDSIGEKMQKILQSVLDGDTIYEGVNLVALTNKPAAIPPPIYRRFAHVVVIKPLEASERITLLRSMMAGVPVADDFESSVGWDSIAEQTEFASGDLLGKIYDQAFTGYLRKVEAHDQAAALEANRQFKELALAGKPITAPERLKIFQSSCPDVVVTGDEYRGVVESLLSQLVVQKAMAQAQDFYEIVDRRIEEAFKGVE